MYNAFILQKYKKIFREIEEREREREREREKRLRRKHKNEKVVHKIITRGDGQEKVTQFIITQKLVTYRDTASN